MQPNLPAPQQNPYDFIMGGGQPQQPGKMPGLRSGGGGSKLQRLIFVGVGALVLIILVVIVMNLLSSAGKGEITTLKNLAAEQAEIIRVADLGVETARSRDTKTVAAITAVTVRTMAQRTTKLLSIKGAELTKAEKVSAKNSKTDDALTAALANNRYDEVFIEYLTGTLGKYQAGLKSAYEGTAGVNDREVLSAAFESTALITESISTAR